MTDTTRAANLLAQLDHLNEQQLRRLLVEHLTRQKLGLYWEANAIERDAALNADLVLPRLVREWSHRPQEMGEDAAHNNLIIEGDNFDSLRLLKATGLLEPLPDRAKRNTAYSKPAQPDQAGLLSEAKDNKL